jgi:hypothetical protein
MQLSRHAEIRSKQRAIPKSYIDIIMEYGTPTRRPGNALEYKLKNRDKNKVINHLKRMIQKVDSCTGKAVLVNAENFRKVITVYNLY